jgi:outer membrane protein
LEGGSISGMKKLFFLLLSVVFLFSIASSAAGEAPVLTLNQMIQMALEKSPEMKEAEQNIVAAQSDLAQAKAGQWAQLDAFAAAGPAQNADLPLVVVTQSLGGGQSLGQLQGRDYDSVSIFGTLDFAIIQPLYTFGKISNRQDAAASGVGAQRAAKDRKRAEVVVNIKELYYGTIVANQGIGAADDANQFIKDARQRIQRMLRVGSPNVSDVDLHRLETFESEVTQFKAKAESGARMAYLALKKNIGLKEDQEFRLDLKELPKDTRELDRQEEYMSKALENRPELEELKKGIEARKALVDAARADLYPSFFLAAIGSFAGAPGRERMSISYFRDDFNHSEGGFFLGTSWHFDFGIGTGKVSKARAEHQKLLHTKEYAERNIPLEVAKYYQNAVEYQKSFQAYEKGMIAARKWIVAAFANFDIGTGTAKDMFDAIDRYGKNRGEYLVSLYNYHVALAKLSYAIGERWSEAPDQAVQEPRS